MVGFQARVNRVVARTASGRVGPARSARAARRACGARRRTPLLAGLAFGLLFVAGACSTTTPGGRHAPPLPDDGIARPPFERVDGGLGATLLLLGTIHLGPTEGWSYSPEIEGAFDGATGLVLELDPTAAEQEAVADALAANTILPPGPTLPHWLSKETRRWLDERDAALEAAGFSENARSRFEPWYVALRILEISTRGSAFTTQTAVETDLLARNGDRPLRGLETLAVQLDLFHRMPMAMQDLLLRDALRNMDDATAQLERLALAWRTSDRATLVTDARRGIEIDPELESVYVRILDDRNRSWLPALRALLDEPERRGERWVVGVGAMHLIGETGVPRLLEREGYRVERIH